MCMCKYVICTESNILGMIYNTVFKLEGLMHDFPTFNAEKMILSRSCFKFGQWQLGTNFCVSPLFVIVTNTRCKST